MMEFTLLIPEGPLLQGEAELVVARGVVGELGILPGHIPLTTELEPGILRVKLPEGERRFRLPGGTLQVDQGRVLVLAEEAEEID
ncbi:MAG: ATP synthase F1 subunit epsilon [Candidatus Bipolaricaulia bacterium]